MKKTVLSTLGCLMAVSSYSQNKLYDLLKLTVTRKLKNFYLKEVLSLKTQYCIY